MSNVVSIASSPRAPKPPRDNSPRYDEGWRQGKPVEDPEKTKRWGVVAANPSEHLIVLKNGQIDKRRSGQGARVFKLPWETVAVVPTTLQKVTFAADQVTREKVGVEVSGVAVYRIAEPELAFRCLNFSYGERASEKLSATLADMFVGASRRLIANLSLDECLTQRKESIARFLMEEIAPVVSGRGRPDDQTDSGWGVVIDTIEIHEVRIQSEQVFEDLQAPYRSAIAAQAALAELQRREELTEKQEHTERRIAELQIGRERAARIGRAQANAEAALAEVEHERRARAARDAAVEERLAREAELEQHRLERLAEQQLTEVEQRARVAAREQEAANREQLARIEAEQARHKAQAQAELAVALEEQALERARRAAELEQVELERQVRAARREMVAADRRGEATLQVEVSALSNEIKAEDARLEAQRQRALADVEMLLAPHTVARDWVTVGLPHVARALSQSMGTVNYTQLGGDGGAGPIGLIAQGVGQLMHVARGLGFEGVGLSSAQERGEAGADEVSPQG